MHSLLFYLYINKNVGAVNGCSYNITIEHLRLVLRCFFTL